MADLDSMPVHDLRRRARAMSCRTASCRADVVFGTTEGGRSMPLDPCPDVSGNVAVHIDGAGRIRCRVVTPERPLLPFERLHLSHFATCHGLIRPPAPATEGLATVTPLYLKRAERGRA